MASGKFTLDSVETFGNHVLIEEYVEPIHTLEAVEETEITTSEIETTSETLTSFIDVGTSVQTEKSIVLPIVVISALSALVIISFLIVNKAKRK